MLNHNVLNKTDMAAAGPKSALWVTAVGGPMRGVAAASDGSGGVPEDRDTRVQPALADTRRQGSPGSVRQRQAGFSLIEVSIVTAIVLLIAMIAIPAVGSYVIENKVPRVGEELARFVLQTQINAQPDSVSPYAGVQTRHLANMVQDSGLLSVRNPANPTPTVLHGLGSEGKVEVSPVDAGAEFSITLDKVSHAACPGLASVMQRLAHTIVISSSSGGSATVKGDGVAYSALAAESQCARGNVNTFAFTVS